MGWVFGEFQPTIFLNKDLVNDHPTDGQPCKKMDGEIRYQVVNSKGIRPPKWP